MTTTDFQGAPASKAAPPNDGSGTTMGQDASPTEPVQEPGRQEEPFPLSDLKDAAKHLRRPFTAEAVRYKVQSSWASGCLVVAYVDARLVTERLNLVVPGQWSERYERVTDGLLCRLTVCGVAHEDVGDGKGKTAYSDAFKRAAVKHGIGVSIYAIPQARLTTAEHSKLFERDGKTVRLTALGEQKLRERYDKWLVETGRPKFGDPLDHGDVLDSQGDVEATDGAPAADELEDDGFQPPEQDGSPEAETLRKECRALYDGIRQTDPSGLPPAQFGRQLVLAGASVDDLKTYRDSLDHRLTELTERELSGATS